MRKGSGESQLRSVNGWITLWTSGVQCLGGPSEGLGRRHQIHPSTERLEDGYLSFDIHSSLVGGGSCLMGH